MLKCRVDKMAPNRFREGLPIMMLFGKEVSTMRYMTLAIIAFSFSMSIISRVM